MNSWHVAKTLKANSANYSLLYDLRNDLVISSYYPDVNGRYIWAYREFESMFGHSVLVYEKHNILKNYIETQKLIVVSLAMLTYFPTVEILKMIATKRLYGISITEYYPFPQSLLINFLKRRSDNNRRIACWTPHQLNPKPQLIAMKILAGIHGSYLIPHIGYSYITNTTGQIAMQTCPLAFESIDNPTPETTKLAVMLNPRNLEFAQDQTEEICLIAVTKRGQMLKFCKHKTHAIQIAALRRHILALPFITPDFRTEASKIIGRPVLDEDLDPVKFHEKYMRENAERFQERKQQFQIYLAQLKERKAKNKKEQLRRHYLSLGYSKIKIDWLLGDLDLATYRKLKDQEIKAKYNLRPEHQKPEEKGQNGRPSEEPQPERPNYSENTKCTIV